MEPIHAIEYQSERRDELLALFRRNFGAWATQRLAERWDWQYGAGNPWRALRRTSGLVALDGGGIVGGELVFPVPWRVDGQRTIFLCGGDFAIDRPFRIRLLPQLVRAFFDRPPVMANGLHPSLWTMGASLGALWLPMSRLRFVLPLRNHGWICRAARRRLPAPARHFVSPAAMTGKVLGSKAVSAVLRRLAGDRGPLPGKSLPEQGPVADVRPLERFEADYDRLWEQARQKFSMTLDKDAEYLSWRYLRCPTLRDPILRGLYRDGKLSAVAVGGVCMVLDVDGRPCGANGEILELITSGAGAREIEALLLAVCRELDRRGVDRIGAFAHDPTVREAMERIGFQPEEDGRFDTIVAFDRLDPKTGRAQSTDGVYLTAGDGDMLNAYLA